MDKVNTLKAKRKRKEAIRQERKIQRLLEKKQKQTSESERGQSVNNNVLTISNTDGKQGAKSKRKHGEMEITGTKKKKKQKVKKEKGFTQITDISKHGNTTNSSDEAMDTTPSSFSFPKVPKIKDEEKLVIGPKKLKEDIMQYGISAFGNNKSKNNSSATPQNSKKTKTKLTSPVVHQGKFVFSKFDFLDNDSSKSKYSLNQRGKDYKTLLEKVKTKNLKIEEVRKTDSQKAAELQNKYEWKVALAKAAGEKVKDDENMLHKALKKKEYKKNKMKKNWEERSQKVQQKMDQKQKKRTENIKKKKQGRIDNKIKRAKKKGRLFSGF